MNSYDHVLTDGVLNVIRIEKSHQWENYSTHSLIRLKMNNQESIADRSPTFEFSLKRTT